MKNGNILNKTIIGRNTRINFGRRAVGVPAKIDTGADSSSVWASNIRIDKDGVLKFSLFGQGSPYYNGKVFKRIYYKVVLVKSSTGEEQIRYRTRFTIDIEGRRIRAMFNLSDRSKNKFPVLIGSRTLFNKFVVDVTRKEIKYSSEKSKILNQELDKNPYKFHKKYTKKGKN